jgi:lysophospholipase L1-like esterase
VQQRSSLALARNTNHRDTESQRPVSFLCVSVTLLFVALGLFASVLLVPAPAAAQGGGWEPAIAAFEASDRSSPPPTGEIVFVGSSSIRLWDAQRYFPNLKIINRGFGGSHLSDAVRYADRIVIPYKPRIVVVYAGDNDIYGGATSEQVAVFFEQFVRTVRAKLPEVRIVFIGIKPSLLRWDVIERMRLANDIIRGYAEHDDNIAFVDVDQAMLGWDEKPRPELFVEDGLHLTPAGYELWSALLGPLLRAR